MTPLAEAESRALFILSFRQRDELAAQAAEAGWRVVAARRRADADRRFLASGAGVAVIDARGALDDGLAAAADLGGHVSAGGGALLVLVSHSDVGALDRFFDAGATHFLGSPATREEFVAGLRFAARHADRLAESWPATPAEDPLGWRWTAGADVRLTPALATRLGTAEVLPRARALRAAPVGIAREMLVALRRLAATGATAVAHDTGHGRVVQHLQRDGAAVVALVELLGTAPDPADRLRHAWDGARDAAAARGWIGERLAGGAEPVGAMLIALTRFDIVNAAYGRLAGDQLLRVARHRIDEVARELGAAVVARTGGSEFLLAAQTTPERLALAAARLARSLSRPFAVEGAPAMLGSRIGTADAEAADDAAALLRRAGEALAAAKASDVGVQRAASSPGIAPIDALAVDLHRAIERGELEVLFQPQVRIATGAIVGVEALARWEHPSLGVLGADLLFAAADRADLGAALSDHVQALALARAAAWPASLASLRLSINVTAGDLARPEFAARFLDRVAASGFPVTRLTAEVTETGLIAELDAAAGLLSTLRAAGCRVAIDDFGTGYSSLAYLKALPLDYLKIDKALAQDIAGSARDRVVVRGVIAMAHSLAMTVIAEGVETPEQRDLLAAEDCDLYQGFLCAEPLDVAALTRLVEG